MVKTAFLFPGQGSQTVTMGQDLYENHPEAKRLMDEAGEVMGKDLAKLCFEGPEEELNLTENTQPAILTHSIMALKTLSEHGIESVLVAGHSLGEYSALVAAGALQFRDAVRLVHLRGKFMQEAVPVGVGGMAAIIGLPFDEVKTLCQKLSSDGNLVQPANMNSPQQTVIAGHKPAVEQVVEEAGKAGAKKSVLLPVSAPFHCDLMKPAELKLQEELVKTEFSELRVPVVTNVDARINQDAGRAREALREQVCSPVRWVETMEVLQQEKVQAVVEIGPGRVLSGLLRRFDKSIDCYQVSDCASLEKTVAALKG